MANVSTYTTSLIKGRFTYTQVLASNVAGDVPTIDDLAPGDLALNSADQILYSANSTDVFQLMSVEGDLSAFITNVDARALFVNNEFANANFIWNADGNAAIIPIGNSSNRPIPAANGYLRYNEELESFEGYVRGSWVYVDNPGGANQSVQFNDSENFNGSSGFLFDKDTNNATVANTLYAGALTSGTGIANTTANSTLIKISTNSSVMANLSSTNLAIGISYVNATGVGVGANIFLDSVRLFIGNTIANVFANSILVSVSNATSIANLQPSALTIGNSIANNLGLSVGGSGGMVINTTAYAAGANVILDTVKLFIGNTTANLLANSILVSLANSTSIANLQPGLLTIGSSVVNTTAVTTGFFFGDGSNLSGLPSASPGGSDTYVQFNDSTAFGGTAGFTFTKGTNSVFIANLATIGATTVNTTHIYVGGGVTNVVWHAGNDGTGSGLDADLLDGQSSAFYLAASAYTAADVLAKLLTVDGSGTGLDADLLDSHDTAYFTNATVFASGTTLANATGVYNGANLFIDTVKLSIGNTTANLTANSIIVQLANSTATTNVTPDGIKVGATTIANTAGFFGNGAGLTSLTAAGAGGTNTQVQFNDSASFLGLAGFTYNKDTNNVFIGNTVTVGATTVNTTHIYVGGGSSNLVWHAGNDGTGSGLDADLLDGHDTAYFLAASAYTAADVLSKLLTVDGTGTGLDADLLDGHDTAYFTNATVFSSGTTLANSLGVYNGANLFIDTVKLSIGNTIANLTANSILVSVANATGTANLQPTQLVIGSATVNSTAFLSGANLFIDTTKLFVGNTIANLTANSIIVFLANATASANLQPGLLTIGTSIVNTTAAVATTLIAGVTTVNTTHIYVGGGVVNVVWHAGNDGSGSGLDADLLDGHDTAFFVAATDYTAADVLSKLLTVDGSGTGLDADLLDSHDTAYFTNATVFSSGTTIANALGVYLGANVFIDTVKLSIGNTTVNAFANSLLLQVSDAGGVANLKPTSLVIGSATVNSTAFVTGANVFLDTVKLSIGSATVNSTANSIILQVRDATFTTNVISDGLKVGATTVVNTAGFFGNGAGLTSISATAAPGGADTQVQYNDATVLAGSAGFTFTKTTNNVVIANTATIGATTVNTTHIYVGGGGTNVVWHAGNDGSGSGLDADLLDGHDTSYFANASAGTLPPGFVSILIQNGGSNAQINFINGKARDSTDTVDIVLTLNPLTKNCATTWAQGNNAGGLDTGALAASTIYYCWVIRASGNGAVDALLSTSATAPTMPGSWDAKQRVGFVRTDAGSRFLAFFQGTHDPSYFRYSNSISDINVTTVNSTSQNFTLSVPGSSKALIRIFANTASNPTCPCSPTPTYGLIRSPNETAQAPVITGAPLFNYPLQQGSSISVYAREFEIETNSSGQVAMRQDIGNPAGFTTRTRIITFGAQFGRGIIP